MQQAHAQRLVKQNLQQVKPTKVAIIGGGTAGMTVCAQLLKSKQFSPAQITVFDSNSVHYYQPAFTMVGGGLLGTNHQVSSKSSLLCRPMSQLFDSGVNFVNDAVHDFDAPNNTIYTSRAKAYKYDYLVINTGISLRYDLIEGAYNALDDVSCPVASVYRLDYAKKMNKFASNLSSGKLIFTQPPLPFKCAGAPQKIVYLSEDRAALKKREDFELEFHTHAPVMFGVKRYSDVLQQIALQRGVDVHFQSELVKIDGVNQKAFFKQKNGTVVEKSFDLLHVVPPQSGSQFLIENGGELVDEKGFVDVDKFTLRSKHFENVFALGDCTNTPNAKTAAAVFAQAPVLVQNLIRSSQGKICNAKYDGYGSCALFVGAKKLMLAEFLYDGVPKETFSAFTQQKYPNRAFYHLKKNIFPFAYWNLAPRAWWYGNNILKPKYTD